MVQIDFRPAIGQLRSEFANVSDKLFARAVSRALNHVASTAKTEASREIRKHYAIPAKDAKADIVLQRSSPTTLTAFLRSAGKPLPLSAFNPNERARGISVKIKAKRELIRGAFIATLSNGHRGVFARGHYGQGSFQFRKQRKPGERKDLPINELFSKSIPAALMNRTVIESLKSRIESDLPQRTRHELRFALSELAGRGNSAEIRAERDNWVQYITAAQQIPEAWFLAAFCSSNTRLRPPLVTVAVDEQEATFRIVKLDTGWAKLVTLEYLPAEF